MDDVAMSPKLTHGSGVVKPSPMDNHGEKRAPCWQFFSRIDGISRCLADKCEFRSYDRRSQNLEKHLAKKHSELYEQLLELRASNGRVAVDMRRQNVPTSTTEPSEPRPSSKRRMYKRTHDHDSQSRSIKRSSSQDDSHDGAFHIAQQEQHCIGIEDEVIVTRSNTLCGKEYA
jgi:hypothetical protein